MATTTLPAGSVGVDYSFARPTPAALKSAGVSFVSRYLAEHSKKVIDASERDELFAAGLTLLLNWEQASGDFLVPSKGRSQGESAARLASGLGYPTELPILVSCDHDASSASDLDKAAEYFTDFKAGSGWLLGVYAGSPVANRLLGEGLVSFVWAPNASSWNHGIAYERRDIQQYFGEKHFPELARFGDQIDPDRAEQPIAVWSGTGAGTGGGHDTGGGQDTGDSGRQTGETTYTVRSGDSWFAIAERELGSGTKDTELAAYNGRTINDVIHPGEVLKIPPSSGGQTGERTYTVRSGDSWFAIAERELGSGTKDTELAAYNGRTINDVIHPGEVVKIPPS